MASATAAAAVSRSRRLKILCLHGHGQDPKSFREKTGGFRKEVKKLVDWHWIAAPHPAPSRDSSTGTGTEDASSASAMDAAEGDDSGLSWYDFGALMSGASQGRMQFLYSVQQSLDSIDAACASEGPFDGLFAFSQGASLAALVMALGELRSKGVDVSAAVPISIGPNTTFRFAAMCAGFLPGEGRTSADVPELDGGAVLRPVFDAAAPIESSAAFVLFGSTDRVIPAERSERLARLYRDAVVVTHDGGHHVPSSAAVRKSFRNFVEDQHRVITM